MPDHPVDARHIRWTETQETSVYLSGCLQPSQKAPGQVGPHGAQHSPDCFSTQTSLPKGKSKGRGPPHQKQNKTVLDMQLYSQPQHPLALPAAAGARRPGTPTKQTVLENGAELLFGEKGTQLPQAPCRGDACVVLKQRRNERQREWWRQPEATHSLPWTDIKHLATPVHHCITETGQPAL